MATGEQVWLLNTLSIQHPSIMVAVCEIEDNSFFVCVCFFLGLFMVPLRHLTEIDSRPAQAAHILSEIWL
jgi:hypothetical protein